MMHIQVLGSGCQNCKVTFGLIEAAAAEAGKKIELTKVEKLQEIMAYGIFSTPGVVIDGKVVHAGGVPSKSKIAEWLSGACSGQGHGDGTGGCCGGGGCH